MPTTAYGVQRILEVGAALTTNLAESNNETKISTICPGKDHITLPTIHFRHTSTPPRGHPPLHQKGLLVLVRITNVEERCGNRTV